MDVGRKIARHHQSSILWRAARLLDRELIDATGDLEYEASDSIAPDSNIAAE
jgi:hypothetical protein